MSASVDIRPAVPADLPAIGRLGALLVRTHHDFDPRRFIAATPQTEHRYASFLGTQLDEPNIVILVAVRDSEVLGARGAPRVVLSTAERNEAAQRLFARAGFRRTMLEMTRELSSGAS